MTKATEADSEAHPRGHPGSQQVDVPQIIASARCMTLEDAMLLSVIYGHDRDVNYSQYCETAAAALRAAGTLPTWRWFTEVFQSCVWVDTKALNPVADAIVAVRARDLCPAHVTAALLRPWLTFRNSG